MTTSKELSQADSAIGKIKSSIFDNGYITLIIFILFSIVAGIVGHINIWGMTKFLYITLAAIFLPGWLIQQQLKINFKDGISCVFFSFALGVALSILIYACLLLCNIQTYTAYIFYGISILSIGLFFYKLFHKTSIYSIHTDTKDVIKVTTLLSVILIFAFIIFQLSSRSALYIGYQKLFNDASYWLKNCIASSKGYPLPELSMSGLHLYWHLFSCFFIAMLSFCTGIEFYDLCYSLSYLYDMFLFVGAVYIFLNELLNDKKLVYLGCFILFFVTGFEKQLAFYYIEHIYQCKLGLVTGLSFSLFSFTFFIKSLKKERVFSQEFFLSLFFFAATTGGKVPYACILLVAIGILYVFKSDKKRWWKHLLALGCFIAVFLVIAKLFIIDNNALVSDSSNHKLSLSFQGSALLIPKAYDIYLFLSNYIGSVLSWFIVTGSFLLGINYVVFGMFLFTLIVAILKKKYTDVFLCSLVVMVLVGMTLALFVKHPGRSQLYFACAIIPFAVLFSLMIFEQCNFKLKKKSLYVLNGFIVISLLLTLIFSPKIFVGGGTYKANTHTTSIEGDDITRDEIIALQWVRDSLPEDIILATNKIFAPKASRSFVTSVYSERQIYIEGYDFTNLPKEGMVEERLDLLSSYFNGEEWAKNKLITEEGVSHVALYKAFKEPQDYLGTVLYENNAMVIYELK